MKIKNLVPLASLIISVTAYAYPDITIHNDTNLFGTAKVGSSPCSSAISGGVLAPKTSRAVPGFVFDMYCAYTECKAEFYANKNCSGESLATANINRTGVTNVETHNTDFYVNFDGQSIEIAGGPAAK